MKASLKQTYKNFSVLSTEVICFMVVYESQSIHAASRRLSLDPGNISRVIKKIEEKLGVVLFSRHKTGVSPTADGQILYISCKTSKEAFNQTLIQRQSLYQKIRIGFSSVIGYSHFSPLLTEALLRLNLFPDFTILSSFELIEKIKTRELDFILTNNPTRFPGLISKIISVEKIILCSSTAENQNILLIHPDMLGYDKINQSLANKHTWIIKDYFMIAKMVSQNQKLMGLLPEQLFLESQGLKKVKELKLHGKISAISWPGSVGVELMKILNIQK